MAQLSHNKCWYCEIKYPRSDFQVDHFRPKIRIKDYEDPNTVDEGYWWLAFDYRNFRLSCSYCNIPHRCNDGKVRGKVDFFPLLPGSTRCSFGGKLEDEEPLLLDPLDPLDHSLIWFYPDGRATPSSKEKDNFGIDKKRADVTIDLLNLNSYKTVVKRRIIYNRCDDLVFLGDLAMKAYQDAKKKDNRQLEKQTKRAFKRISKQIKDLTLESAELSTVAKIYLKRFDQPWLKQIL